MEDSKKPLLHEVKTRRFFVQSFFNEKKGEESKIERDDSQNANVTQRIKKITEIAKDVKDQIVNDTKTLIQEISKQTKEKGIKQFSKEFAIEAKTKLAQVSK